MLRIETRARARALQLLYAWESDGRPPLPELLARVMRLTRPAPAVQVQAAVVVTQPLPPAVRKRDTRKS